MDKKKAAAALHEIIMGLTTLADLLENETADTPKAAAPAVEKKPEKAAAPKPELEKPASTSTITFEDVRGVLAGKAGKGHRTEVKNILKEHSLACLSDIAKHPELFEALMKEGEAIADE